MEDTDKHNILFPSDIEDSSYFADGPLQTPSIPELSVESIRIKKIGRGKRKTIFHKDTFDVIPPAENFVPGTEFIESDQRGEPHAQYYYNPAWEDDAEFYDEPEHYDPQYAEPFDSYFLQEGHDEENGEFEREYGYAENNLEESNFVRPGFEYEPKHYYEENIEENATLVRIPAPEMPINSSDHFTDALAQETENTAISSEIESQDEILIASVSINQIGLKSVAKASAAVGGAIGIIWVLFLGILYFFLDILGVWEKFNSSFSGGSSSVSGSLLSTWIVLAFTLITGALLFIGIVCCSLFIAVIYNLCAETFGGIRVELKDQPLEKKLDRKSKKQKTQFNED